MAADALVSLGVVIAGALILFTGWLWLDSAISLLVAVVILLGTWGLLHDSVNLALDGVPEGVDLAAVKAYLAALPGVTAVHDLHVWGMSTTETALTAHLVMPAGVPDDTFYTKLLLHQAATRLARALRYRARDRAGRAGRRGRLPFGERRGGVMRRGMEWPDLKRTGVTGDTTTGAAMRHAGGQMTATDDVIRGMDTCEGACAHPEAVARAKRAVPDEDCVNDASALLKAVADPTRLRMLSALSAEELCVHDLALVAGISESATSHQLRLLRAHRLVASRKVGRAVYYHLADQHVTLLIGNALEHARER